MDHLKNSTSIVILIGGGDGRDIRIMVAPNTSDRRPVRLNKSISVCITLGCRGRKQCANKKEMLQREREKSTTTLLRN